MGERIEAAAEAPVMVVVMCECERCGAAGDFMVPVFCGPRLEAVCAECFGSLPARRAFEAAA